MTTVEIKELKKEVKRYVDQADERMIKVVYAMFEADQQEDDWINNISEGEKASIQRGLDQLAQGKGIPHEQVKKMHPEWFSK
jgi:predicted transcriptional regulator